MTFLEYVCERLMGPPASSSNGWSCPRHEDNHPSFNTRPPKQGCKVRFCCFSCGWWGDEFDLLKEFYPGEDYSERRVRMAALRIDFQHDHPEEAICSGEGEIRGLALLQRLMKEKRIDYDDILEVVGESNHQRALALDIEVLGNGKGRLRC